MAGATFAARGAESAVERLRFLLLVVLLFAVFLLGGGARDDIPSLLVLRPATALIFIAALWSALPSAWARAPSLVAVGGAALTLVALHLVPLPPVVWTHLSGHHIAAEVFQAAGMRLPWQPLSLAPQRSWNAFFSLLAPLAALLLGLSLSRRNMERALAILICLGILSAFVGLLQISGVERLYFYAITNRSMSVGLFANRNHQALLLACMLPLLALFARTAAGRREIVLLKRRLAFAGALALLPLVLVTGSRAGLICAAIGTGLAVWIFSMRADADKGPGLRPRWILPAMACTAVALIGGILFFQARAPALERLLATDPTSELRWQAAPVIWHAAQEFFPLGSGFGSFVEVYYIYEPQRLLSPVYLNHAHNDWLELLLTGGVPAIGVTLIGVLAVVRLGLRALRAKPDQRSRAADIKPWARAGLSVIFLLLGASLVDYPLRTPLLAVVLTLAASFVVHAGLVETTESNQI